jgi:hypothetical protein
MWMWRSGWKSDLTPRSSGLQLAQEGILHDSKKEEEKETEKGGKNQHIGTLLSFLFRLYWFRFVGTTQAPLRSTDFWLYPFLSLSLSTSSFIRRRSNMFSFLHIFFFGIHYLMLTKTMD